METADRLLAQANQLGQRASVQTGIPFAPTQGQSTTGMSQIQQGSLSAGASNPISSASLTPATPLAIPTVPFNTNANAVMGQVQASRDQTAAKLNQDEVNKRNTVDESKNDLTDLQNEILGVQGQRSGLDKQAGLDTLNISIADLTNTLESSQKAQGEELKALSGSGLTDVQKVQQGREINRRYAIEQSDTLFALNQTQRRFDAATANIDRKIKLQLEPLETKLKFSELFYTDNKTALTKAEDRAFQNLIDTNNKAYTEALANKTAIGDIQKVALANGINIPLSVLAKLNTATDANEAYSILQQNGISLENPLDREAKLANIEQSRASTAQSRASIRKIDADIERERIDGLGLGGLDQKVISRIQSAPEYKTISGVIPAMSAIKSYFAAVEKSGSFELLNGTEAGNLKASYGNAIAAWKTLAGLGALSGADFGLAENVIPEPSLFTRNSKVKSQLNSATVNAITQAEVMTKRLTQLYPSATNLLGSQLDDMRVIANPEKFKVGEDGKVYEITDVKK